MDETLYKVILNSKNIFYKGYKDKYVLSNNGNRFLIVNQPYPIRNRLLKVEDIETMKSIDKVGLRYILTIDTNIKRKKYINSLDRFELLEVTENEIWENGLI